MTNSSNISKNLLSTKFFFVKHRSVIIPWIKSHFVSRRTGTSLCTHHFPSRSKQMLSIINGEEPES